MALEPPLRVFAGERAALYVHSTLDGDEAIVYDDERGNVTLSHKFFDVLPGMAHVSQVAFDPRRFVPVGSGTCTIFFA